MGIGAILALVGAATEIVKTLGPEVEAFLSRNDISVDEQAKVRAEYEALRAAMAGGTAHKGKEWELSTASEAVQTSGEGQVASDQ